MTTCKLSELISPAFFDVHRQIKAGKVDELLAKGGFYARLYNSQFAAADEG